MSSDHSPTTPADDRSRLVRIARSEIPMPWKAPPTWRGLLDEASLPAPARDVIERVVGRTRLWKREKREVTRELVAHFADALAAGRTAEQAAAEFGDPIAAAALIRIAKRRQRPMWWKAWRASSGAVCGVLLLGVVVYAYLAARLWLGSPTISRDFIAEFNAKHASAPEAERAWPLYLAALKALEPVPQATVEAEWKEWPAKPGDATWPQVRAWLDRQEPALMLIRRAAASPSLSFPLTTDVDDELAAASAAFRRDQSPPPPLPPLPATGDGPPLFAVLFPHLGTMRDFARILKADSAAAIESGDAERLEADLAALLGIAGHRVEFPSLIHSLVEFAVLHLTSEVMNEALKSGLLPEEALARLAHRIARFDDARLSIGPAMEGERMMVADLLQRLYTDDGAGDGFATAAGMRMLGSITAPSEVHEFSLGVRAVAWPLQAGAMPRRRAVSQAADRLYDAVQRDAATPFWVGGGFGSGEVVRDILEGESGRRHTLLRLMIPATTRALSHAEGMRQRRDGTLVAIALEMHHRRTGSYPATLEELSPALLPAVPRDRFDGRPLRYILVEGRPVVYSIGSDLIDDGGMRPSEGDANLLMSFDQVHTAQAVLRAANGSVEHGRGEARGLGDWLLYDRR